MERHDRDQKRRRLATTISPVSDDVPGTTARSDNDFAAATGATTTPLDIDDFTRRVVQLRNRADRNVVGRALRLMLGAVALIVFIRGFSKVVGSGADHHDVHSTRHLGTFIAAYAVALAAVVHRPSRARSILPLATFVASTLLLTAIFDLLEDLTPLSRELLHLPEIAGAVLVWLIARRITGTTTPARTGRHEPTLRAVE